MKSKDIMKVANSMDLGHFVLKVNTENKLGNYIKYTYSVYIINSTNQTPLLLKVIERVIQGMTPDDAYKEMDCLLLEFFFKLFKYGISK
jgi:hypothetical protein